MAEGEKKPLVLTNRILKPAEKRVLAKLQGRANQLTDMLEDNARGPELVKDQLRRGFTSSREVRAEDRLEEATRMKLRTTYKMMNKVRNGALIPKSLLKTAGSAPSVKSGLGAAVARWNELFQTN